jgi:cell pole-organizing protein PopZ
LPRQAISDPDLTQETKGLPRSLRSKDQEGRSMFPKRRHAIFAAMLLMPLGAAALAQPASPPAAGPIGTMGEATTQDYALRLRDAEAKLRAAHEGFAAAGSSAPSTSSESPLRQDLLEAARQAGDMVRNAPATIAGQPVHAQAERSFREGLERLGGSERRDEADTARAMLQALSALREAVGAPPAAPTTGGSTPAEPAASGGGRT